MVVALAAPAGGEIEFERDGFAHGGDGGVDGGLGEDGAAEVGVQHGAGEVENGAQRGFLQGLKPRLRLLREIRGGENLVGAV